LNAVFAPLKTPAKFTREPDRLGSEIATFGFPLRGILADQLNMTTGIVSSLAGIGGDLRVFQISAAVQPGNSGGPVIDRTGAVVGMVTSRLNRVRGPHFPDTATTQLVNLAIKKESIIRFLRGSGIDPDFSEIRTTSPTTDLAREAAGYTVGITCTRYD
jgi:S1-C subfamily serine protease